MQTVFFIKPKKKVLYQYAKQNIPDNQFLKASSQNKRGFELYFDKFDQLTLKDDKNNKLQIHFDSGKNYHRLQFGSSKQQPLARACGLNKQTNLKILDATAGFAQDAFVLATLNPLGKTTLIEQHPALYSLIFFAINKNVDNAQVARICKTMEVYNQNSVTFMKKYSNKYDVIYLDPMYPERKKKAKVKKAMQLLQVLIGHIQNEYELFNSALNATKNRVVIKRPKFAPYYAEKEPNFSSTSKSTRFDVYLKGLSINKPKHEIISLSMIAGG